MKRPLSIFCLLCVSQPRTLTRLSLIVHLCRPPPLARPKNLSPVMLKAHHDTDPTNAAEHNMQCRPPLLRSIIISPHSSHQGGHRVAPDAAAPFERRREDASLSHNHRPRIVTTTPATVTCRWRASNHVSTLRSHQTGLPGGLSSDNSHTNCTLTQCTRRCALQLCHQDSTASTRTTHAKRRCLYIDCANIATMVNVPYSCYNRLIGFMMLVFTQP
jgi:hypothetical protein